MHDTRRHLYDEVRRTVAIRVRKTSRGAGGMSSSRFSKSGFAIVWLLTCHIFSTQLLAR